MKSKTEMKNKSEKVKSKSEKMNLKKFLTLVKELTTEV